MDLPPIQGYIYVMNYSYFKYSNVKSHWLFYAAIYNIVWGAVVVAFPNLLFDVMNIPRMSYPQIWQCVGMIVGVYGLGYGIAAYAPSRHWPIVLVGFLGKIFGPLGFFYALYMGQFPLGFIFVLLTNDFLWWIPFYKLLKKAYQDADFN